MSKCLSHLFLGIVSVVLGALILVNLDTIVRFDQRSGMKLRSWFRKKLGNSVLNRELWTVGTPGTPSGLRSSRVSFKVVAIVLLVVGAVIVALSF